MDDKKEFLHTLKTKLYYDRITDEDIDLVKNSQVLSEYQRNLVLLAIYEKQKKLSEISKLVADYKEKHPESEENKAFNTILQRSKNKKSKIFDFLFYDHILRWKIDENLQEKYAKEAKEELASARVPQKEPTPFFRKSFEQPKENNYSYNPDYSYPSYGSYHREYNPFVESLRQYKPRQQVYSPVSNVSDEPVKQQKTPKQASHYDDILGYLDEKRHEIYSNLNSTDVQIQKTAMVQWDKMEALLEKVKQNRNNREFLESLYSKIESLREYENSQSR